MSEDDLLQSLDAELALVVNNPELVIAASEKALTRSDRYGWLKGAAMAHFAKAQALQTLGQYDEALTSYQRANILFADAKEVHRLNQTRFAQARLHLESARMPDAIALYRALLNDDTFTSQTDDLSSVHLSLCEAFMGMGQWQNAETYLSNDALPAQLNDSDTLMYQALCLRLAFYRSGQSSVRAKLNAFQQAAAKLPEHWLVPLGSYFSARYVLRYENYRKGRKSLASWFANYEEQAVFGQSLKLEAALDLLGAEHPEHGVVMLDEVLSLKQCPLSLQRLTHQALADYYQSNSDFERAVTHYQALQNVELTEHEMQAKFQVTAYQFELERTGLALKLQQQENNNQVLASSNALLQMVNRIAMSVNAALSYDTLLERLQHELNGWLEISTLGIATVDDDLLTYVAVQSDSSWPSPEPMALNNEVSWSVRAAKSGRIFYQNQRHRQEANEQDDVSASSQSVAFLPLRCENRVIGILSLQCNQPDAFDLKAVSLFEYMSPVMGIAVANLINQSRTKALTGELNQQKSELNDVRQLVSHLAEHDDLTGLLNRSGLPSRFEQWVERQSFNGFFIKISNTEKAIEQMGYGGDESLIKVSAQRLANRLRPDDLLFRVSEDMFLILTQVMPSSDQVMEFSGQLLALIQQPLREAGGVLCGDAYIGVIEYPVHGETLEEFMVMGGLAVNYASAEPKHIFVIE